MFVQEALDSGAPYEGLHDELHLSWLGSACDVLASRTVEWFPQYGCAVVCLQGGPQHGWTLEHEPCVLGVVALDEWTVQVHRYESSAVHLRGVWCMCTALHVCSFT